MITLVEALNYRCLKYVYRTLEAFHVLVGPNASGKTTFMDTIGFMSDLLLYGLDEAIERQTSNPLDLLYQHRGTRFELAVEARVPDDQRSQMAKPELSTIRYEIAIGFDETNRAFEFKAERLLLKTCNTQPRPLRLSFPEVIDPPSSLAIPRSGTKYLLNKVPRGTDNYYSEARSRSRRSWAPSYNLGPKRSAFHNLPPDEGSFPVATWFREYLQSGVQKLTLNSHVMKRPSSPHKAKGLSLDGSNLPWVIARLQKQDPDRHRAWILHLQTVLPDLVDISTVERPEDRHRYMRYQYSSGLDLPSWMVSDGTLRLTALTLLAYLPDLTGILLIEEPENGIHPMAVSAAYDSLSSLYGAQVLLASHSSVLLSASKRDEILCFGQDQHGATDIVPGSEHPALRNWQRTADLGMLLASGVLG